MAGKKSAATAESIDPTALYEVNVARRFKFERVEFGPLIDAEIRGERLSRLLASEHAGAVKGYTKKD